MRSTYNLRNARRSQEEDKDQDLSYDRSSNGSVAQTGSGNESISSHSRHLEAKPDDGGQSNRNNTTAIDQDLGSHPDHQQLQTPDWRASPNQQARLATNPRDTSQNQATSQPQATSAPQMLQNAPITNHQARQMNNPHHIMQTGWQQPGPPGPMWMNIPNQQPGYNNVQQQVQEHEELKKKYVKLEQELSLLRQHLTQQPTQKTQRQSKTPAPTVPTTINVHSSPADDHTKVRPPTPSTQVNQTTQVNQPPKLPNIINPYIKGPAKNPVPPKVPQPRGPPPPPPTRPPPPQMPTPTPAPIPLQTTTQNPRQQTTFTPPIPQQSNNNSPHTPTQQYGMPPHIQPGYQMFHPAYHIPNQGHQFQSLQYVQPYYAQPYFPQPNQIPQYANAQMQPHPATSAATDIATAIKAAKQFTLPKLTKSIAKDRVQFNFWKKKVILAVSNDVLLTNIVANNATEDKVFDTKTLTTAQAKRLFNGLFTSFDTDIHQQINLTTKDTTTMDGPKLWKQLLTVYSHKALTFRSEEKLIQNYKNFKPNKGESLDDIFIRFYNMEEDLRHNNLGSNIMDPKRRAFQILIEMRDESLRQIAVGIVDGSRGAEWYDITLAQLKKKIKEHLELIGSLNTPPPKKRIPTTTTQLTLEETTPGGEFQHPKGGVTDAEKQIISAMTRCPRYSTLLTFVDKAPGQCSIHPGRSHNLLECLSLKRICNKHNWTKHLQKAIAVRSNKTQNQNETNAPTPAPAPAPPTANRGNWQLRHLGGGRTGNQQQEETVTANATARQISVLESTVSDMRADFARFMKRVEEDTNEDDFLNSLAVDDESDTDIEPDVETVAPTTAEHNENNNTVSPYSTSSVETTVATTKTPTNKPTIYARAVKPLNQIQSLHLRTTTDSGATHDMTGIKDIFEEIFPLIDDNGNKPIALLGDNTTTCVIEGYGYATYTIDGYPVRKLQLYVLALKNGHLTSILQHSKYKGCYFHSEAKTATLAFPAAIITAACKNEMTIKITPISTQQERNNVIYMFDEQVKKKKISFYPESYNTYIDRSNMKKVSNMVKILLHDKNTILPKRATPGSVGYDLHSPDSIKIEPHKTVKIPLGLSIECEPGMYPRIADRSSMATKGITVRGGVIDNDYRGNIIVCLHNASDTPYCIKKEQRIAQLIFEKNGTPCLEQVDEVSKTTRGKGGFGSTNNKRCEAFRINANHVLFTSRQGNHKVKTKMANIPIISQEDDQPIDTIHETRGDTRQGGTQQGPRETVVIELDNNKNSPESEYLSQTVHQIPTDAATTPPSTAHTRSNFRSVDRVNSALPQNMTMSVEDIRMTTGYSKSDPLIRHIKELGDGSVKIRQQRYDVDKINVGATPSMRRVNSNRKPAKEPQNISAEWHMDIVFGPCTEIGGITHSLYFVDRKSRSQFIYPLKNLTSSLLRACRKFIRDTNSTPKTILTDFDPKLIDGETEKFFLDHNIDILAAPPQRQDENGLAERNWQTIVNMARNWLRASLLPSKFWWFMVKRATEVQNILPIKKDNKITTPHTMVTGKKVNYRCLFPMFSTAYIRKPRVASKGHAPKWKPKSLKCIVVGTCPQSDGLLFYHPPSKKILSCGDRYKFDTFHPSGPEFNLKYDNNFTINSRSEIECIHRPPSHEQNTTVFVPSDHGDNYKPARILEVPINENTDTYIVQLQDSGDILELPKEKIKDIDPKTPLKNDKDLSPLTPWIKNGAKVTLYLKHIMKEPKQGYIYKNNNELWYFKPGRIKDSNTKKIPLKDFETLAQSLITNKKLFQGWKNKRTVLTARIIRAKSNVIAKHISAKGLSNLVEPSLAKHHLLNTKDKDIWDRSYKEEYEGLQNLDTWEVITEDEYKRLLPVVGKALPTMAISTIKTDGEGNPVRAKYRIVVLGNLDPHNWSKSDCFAPVLSQAELRLLTALATKSKRKLKSCDVSQAFCQSYLPANKNYVCKPPSGCPLSPKDTYWKLKKTLYGLKRSPRHWYQKCISILKSMGFKQSFNSPCLLVGTLIPGQPPLYIGVYVDDIAYFSESDEVKKEFEKQFGAQIKTKFNGIIDYFLGIKFTYVDHNDGHLSVHLTQEAFTDTLVSSLNLDGPAVTCPATPYRSGLPVDKINQEEFDPSETPKLIAKMQSIIGSLTWLSTSTRPDIATITNILAKYTNKPSKGHIAAAKRVVKYLKGTRTYGIAFHSKTSTKLVSFVKFPIDTTNLLALTDANWGPQDQSKPPKTPKQLELFKSRSLSGFIIWYGGPVHWISKRQAITARSSAEAEIYATDECVKFLLYLRNIAEDITITKRLFPHPTMVYNDNAACVTWSGNMTTKGLRHIQIRENAIRESIENKKVQIEHIGGKVNIADMFTKEEKDAQHFIILRDHMMEQLPIRDYKINPQSPSTSPPLRGGGGC